MNTSLLPPPSSPSTRRRGALRELSTEACAFFAVGLGGLAVDLLVFNLLRSGLVGGPSSPVSGPLAAGAIATAAAIVFNWFGGRYWAFRSRQRPDIGREFLHYVLVALLGLAISLVTLATTHYALGLTSPVADTVSKNVLGLALSSVVRFLLLRRWVWRPKRHTAPPTASDVRSTPGRNSSCASSS